MSLKSRIKKLEEYAGMKDRNVIVWYAGTPRPDAGPNDIILKIVYGQDDDDQEDGARSEPPPGPD